MKEGSYTIWGKAQSVKELVPGAWFVSTAGHGGIKLDRKRNAAVPRGARQEGGWYEEDCNWAVACYVHKDVAEATLGPARKREPGKFGDDYIVSTLKRWGCPASLGALGIK